jgi:hypothetical protein
VQVVDPLHTGNRSRISGPACILAFELPASKQMFLVRAQSLRKTPCGTAYLNVFCHRQVCVLFWVVNAVKLCKKWSNRWRGQT